MYQTHYTFSASLRVGYILHGFVLHPKKNIINTLNKKKYVNYTLKKAQTEKCKNIPAP